MKLLSLLLLAFALNSTAFASAPVFDPSGAASSALLEVRKLECNPAGDGLMVTLMFGTSREELLKSMGRDAGLADGGNIDNSYSPFQTYGDYARAVRKTKTEAQELFSTQDLGLFKTLGPNELQPALNQPNSPEYQAALQKIQPQLKAYAHEFASSKGWPVYSMMVIFGYLKNAPNCAK